MATKDEILNEDVFNAAVAAGQAQKPVYAATFDSQLADIYDKISNRPKFEYNVNADPLYQTYKDKFSTQGKLAMRDTMGQASALTGGYGSTYGQQVGQQTYDSYMTQLTDKIPELYSLAYGMYRDEGNDLLSRYGLLGDQRDTEYGRFRDQMGDWQNERAYQRQVEQDEYNRRVTAQQQAYSNLYNLIMGSGYKPTSAELKAAGMTKDAANALRNEFLRATGQLPAKSSGGGGGGGGRGGGGDDDLARTADELLKKQETVKNAVKNTLSAFSTKPSTTAWTDWMHKA